MVGEVIGQDDDGEPRQTMVPLLAAMAGSALGLRRCWTVGALLFADAW
jgi:hypothetical protein